MTFYSFLYTKLEKSAKDFWKTITPADSKCTPAILFTCMPFFFLILIYKLLQMAIEFLFHLIIIFTHLLIVVIN